jgi:hypothetical protein
VLPEAPVQAENPASMLGTGLGDRLVKDLQSLLGKEKGHLLAFCGNLSTCSQRLLITASAEVPVESADDSVA